MHSGIVATFHSTTERLYTQARPVSASSNKNLTLTLPLTKISETSFKFKFLRIRFQWDCGFGKSFRTPQHLKIANPDSSGARAHRKRRWRPGQYVSEIFVGGSRAAMSLTLSNGMSCWVTGRAQSVRHQRSLPRIVIPPLLNRRWWGLSFESADPGEATTTLNSSVEQVACVNSDRIWRQSAVDFMAAPIQSISQRSLSYFMTAQPICDGLACMSYFRPAIIPA